MENTKGMGSAMGNKITAIVLAAGQGKRMSSSVAKQFIHLQGKPVIYYALKAFEESIVDDVILVTGSDMLDYCRNEIVIPYGFNKVTKVIEGGKERYDSVYRALLAAEASDYVLIHDGARPFISLELIQKITELVQEYKACIIGVPVKETIKIVDQSGIISATPNRNSLWAAQTPQAFEYSIIRKAYDLLHETEGREAYGITDDAMVCETFLKQPVKVIMGDYNNLKLTTPEDLFQAEEIIKKLLCK